MKSAVGHRGGRHTNRPELVERYGFDTKFAYHMIRLGVQGTELLETGALTLPMPEPWAPWLRELRQGGHTKQEALEAAESLEARLSALLTESHLPERPDVPWADAWLIGAYQRSWSAVASAAPPSGAAAPG